MVIIDLYSKEDFVIEIKSNLDDSEKEETKEECHYIPEVVKQLITIDGKVVSE